jgi:NTE family protein
MLSGGGARAAYQVGALGLLADRRPDLRFPIVTGVSAGAINAAFLAGHRGTFAEAARDLAAAWTGLTTETMFHPDVRTVSYSAVRWLVSLGSGPRLTLPPVGALLDTGALRKFLERVIDLPGISANIAAGRLQALGLTAMSYATGENITFVQGAPNIPMWERAMRRGVRHKIAIDHIMASAALPLIFPAVSLDGRYYGDGAVRNHQPLSPAIHLGARRILAVAVTRPRPGPAPGEESYPAPAQILGHLLDSIFVDSLSADAEQLRRINRFLDLLPPTVSAPEDLRPVRFLMIRPSQDLGTLAVEHNERMPKPLRVWLRGLGAHRELNAEFLSYLMFEEPFVRRLIELGRQDAEAQWPAVEKFLEPE